MFDLNTMRLIFTNVPVVLAQFNMFYNICYLANHPSPPPPLLPPPPPPPPLPSPHPTLPSIPPISKYKIPTDNHVSASL